MFELLAQIHDLPIGVVKQAPHGSCLLTPEQLAKYTQLVVQECATINKQHFGVE
jgi:hypothetical protein